MAAASASLVCVNPVGSHLSAGSAVSSSSSELLCLLPARLKQGGALRWQAPAAGCVRTGARASSGEVSTAAEAEVRSEASRWVPVIPVTALPKGERRLVRQDGETILLLWYKSEVFAIENTSPAEGAYSEGFFNAKLTQDGCIVCPSTATTFDLKTGAIVQWYPTNAVLRFLIQPVRQLDVYPVKVDSDYIYVDLKKKISGQSAEIIFGGSTQAGKTATNVDVEETRMVEVDEKEAGGFGFTPANEITNGRAAMIGFTALLIIELVTGKGILKGTGFLDFLYRFLPNFPVL